MSIGSDGKALKLRKLYYSIGEVSELTGVPAHVLRYWEGEFSELAPKKGRNGSRLYQEKDIEMVVRIRDLLYERKFTISGARLQLRESRGFPADESSGLLSEIMEELRAILKLMDR